MNTEHETRTRGRFDGLSVALATPFDGGGDLDLPALVRLVQHVVHGGADVLLALGSTGEAATLEESERERVVQTVLEHAAGRQVLVGTGSNATRQACSWTARAQELGASGALVVMPYYNKPMPRGVLAHFRAVSEAAPGLPIVVYNVPGRTGTNLTPETLAQLWELDALVAVKESSGDLAQIARIARELPAGRSLLSGDDALALASIAAGAGGLVSVTGNLLPSAMTELVDAALDGRMHTARQAHAALEPVFDALFAESNPIPLKAALAQHGLCGDGLRLPLTPAEPATRVQLARVLAAYERAPVATTTAP